MQSLDIKLFYLIVMFAGLSIDSTNKIWLLVLLMVGVKLLGLKFWKAALIWGVVFVRVFWFYEFEFTKLDAYLDDGKVYEVFGVVCGEPDVRLSYVNYIICLEDMVSAGGARGARGARVLVKTDLFRKLNYADRLQLVGKFESPFETEEFSYKDYLKVFRVSGILKLVQSPVVLEERTSFKKTVYELKFHIIEKIEFYLEEPYASLVSGLLLGTRKGFTEEVSEKLRITGLTHIVAVSGYNVSLVILFIEKLLFFVPRNIRFYILVVGIGVFAILAGLSASVVRACIMGVISLVVLERGYTSNALRALLLTAGGMILWNPAFLYADLGFQLSFQATLGILFLVKLLDFKFLPEFLGIREAFILTVSAQIATLPTVVYYFGVISLSAPVINVLVAPLLPVMMLLGFLICVFSGFYWLALGLGVLCGTIGFLFFKCLDFFASLSYSLIEVQVLDRTFLIVIYLLLGGFLFYRYRCYEKDLQE